MDTDRRRTLRALWLTPLLSLSAACGFRLRGSAGGPSSGGLPYRSMYIALPEHSEVRIWLERYIRASGPTEILSNLKDAEAIFQQLQDARQKTVLSVNAQGRVREYRLHMDYRFRILSSKGEELIPENEINLQRDVSFDDSNILAKDMEESLLWRDMNNDLVNQIIRRLSLLRPQAPSDDAR